MKWELPPSGLFKLNVDGNILASCISAGFGA